MLVLLLFFYVDNKFKCFSLKDQPSFSIIGSFLDTGKGHWMAYCLLIKMKKLKGSQYHSATCSSILFIHHPSNISGTEREFSIWIIGVHCHSIYDTKVGKNTDAAPKKIVHNSELRANNINKQGMSQFHIIGRISYKEYNYLWLFYNHSSCKAVE